MKNLILVSAVFVLVITFSCTRLDSTEMCGKHLEKTLRTLDNEDPNEFVSRSISYREIKEVSQLIKGDNYLINIKEDDFENDIIQKFKQLKVKSNNYEFKWKNITPISFQYNNYDDDGISCCAVTMNFSVNNKVFNITGTYFNTQKGYKLGQIYDFHSK